MKNYQKILLVGLFILLIAGSPVVANENNFDSNSLTNYALFDWNIFNWLFPPTVEVDNVYIIKENFTHTHSDGKVESSMNYYLNFNLLQNSADNLRVEVHSYSKSGNQVDFTKNDITGTMGEYSIELDSSHDIYRSNLLIYSGDSLVVNKTTSVVKETSDEKVDEPIKKTSDSTSSGSTTYVGSSKSSKFHYPSCEWAQKISSKNKVVFHSRDEALSAGYVPCQVCGP